MRTSLLYTTAFLLAATQFPCRKSDSNPVGVNNTNDFLWPFTTGNNWVFKTTNYDTLGTFKSTRYDTMIVGRDTSIADQKWFQAFKKNLFWTNKPDGVWQIEIGSSNQKPSLIFKYPGQVGFSRVIKTVFYQLTLL